MNERNERKTVTTGGAPLHVQPRHSGKGVIVSQGSSYVVIGDDELGPLIAAMREVAGQ